MRINTISISGTLSKRKKQHKEEKWKMYGKQNLWHSLTETTFMFCKESTLHGVKNVVSEIEELGSGISRYK